MQHDAIIVGAGHNGMTAAAYLARAGKKVLVLERRDVVGGCAVTEEVDPDLAPGCRVSTASYIASMLRPTIIRIPTIPGHNDSDDNIRATAQFAAGLGGNLSRIELLPYHKFGAQTYRRLGREFPLADLEPPSDDCMQRLKRIVEACGVDARIGG